MISFRSLAMGGVVLSLVLCGGPRARADYADHPELAPSTRCAGLEDASSRTGYNQDCQPLVWDLPAATAVGHPVDVAPLEAYPDYSGGMTDRPPPLYAFDDTSGIPPSLQGFDDPAAALAVYDRPYHALCPLDPDNPSLRDPDHVPYWYALTESRFEVQCRNGSRAYYGPWALGTDPRVFDGLAYRVLTFENSHRLDHDSGGDPNLRYELNVSAEIYDHVAAHHGTCYVSTDPCADATNPAPPGCETSFRPIAEACPGEGTQTCTLQQQQSYGFVAFRSTTARQGRYTMDLPPGRAFPVVEDPLWLCQQHVVSEEPTYTGAQRNFRSQKNGSVGEMVIQLFTESASSDTYKPISMAFDFVASAATTVIPPFTVAPQDTLWHAPFDLAVGMLTMHSHQNMVKGTIDVVPAAAPRPSEPKASCGGFAGGVPAAHTYENYNYFEPEICEYWRNLTDGPLVLRKGEAIHASCVINNGVTPTREISDPSLRRAVEASAVGQELYGRQDSSAYRVRYGCEKIMGVPPGAPGEHARDCPANPSGDGPYDASSDCPSGPDCYCPAGLGYTGRCVPANVVFANTGEDSMCIPIIMYWPLDRLVNQDGSVNGDAVEALESGRVNDVGTPGRAWKSPSDGGSCDDGAGPGGVNVDDPNPITPYKGRRCRAGL